jgi:hypothetical protein
MTTPQIIITQEDPDPIALRASIGGRADIGFYLVYRGSKTDVIEMIQTVLAAFKEEKKSQ